MFPDLLTIAITVFVMSFVLLLIVLYMKRNSLKKPRKFREKIGKVMVYASALAAAAFLAWNTVYFGLTMRPYVSTNETITVSPVVSQDYGLRLGIVVGACLLVLYSVNSVLDEFEALFESADNHDEKSLVEAVLQPVQSVHEQSSTQLPHPTPDYMKLAKESKQLVTDLGWVILKVVEDNSGRTITTKRIAAGIGKNNKAVYDECLILRDHGFLRFVDDKFGTAMVTITGTGLQALRDKKTIGPKGQESSNAIMIQARFALEPSKIVQMAVDPDDTFEAIVRSAIGALNLPPIANLVAAINGICINPSSYSQTAKALGITSGTEITFLTRGTAG
jgi:hypothetical protein